MSPRKRRDMGEWRFLLDENIDPKTATYLKKEEVHVEHVRDSLGQGADDEADILPYSRRNNLIIVTSDLSDFGNLPSDTHAGIVLLYDDTMPAYRVTTGLLTMIDAYSNPGAFTGRSPRSVGVVGRFTLARYQHLQLDHMVSIRTHDRYPLGVIHHQSHRVLQLRVHPRSRLAPGRTAVGSR